MAHGQVFQELYLARELYLVPVQAFIDVASFVSAFYFCYGADFSPEERDVSYVF